MFVARCVQLRYSDLSTGLVLAPERYDPRRHARFSNGVSSSKVYLGDLASLQGSTINRGNRNVAGTNYVVLDACDAKEGFLIARKAPILQQDIGSAKKRIQAGDVIISRLRPYLRQVAYIDKAFFSQFEPETIELVGSTEFFVLRPPQDDDIAYLVPFLLSALVQEVLGASQEGGHHPRFNKETLLELPVPEELLDRKGALSKYVHEAIKHYRRSEGLMASAHKETQTLIG